MKTTTIGVCSAAAALATLAGGAWGQCSVFQKLNRVGATALEQYGSGVALDQGPTSPLLVVGNPGFDGPGGSDVGAFSVWGRGVSWTSKGGSFGPTGGDRMGASVDMGYPYVIAGAPGHLSNRGRARVYRTDNGGSNWTFEADLLATFANSDDLAGASVGVSAYGGGWAVVGVPNHDFHGLADAGAAYFYQRSANGTWSHVFQIWGGDFAGESLERRGTSVAMSKTTRFAVVGGPGGNASGHPAGAGVAYTVQYLDNGFVGSPQTLAPPTGEADAHYGAAVAAEGDIVVIGAPDDDMTLVENFPNGARTDCGRVYVYRRNGFNWDLEAQLVASDRSNGLRFGSSLSTDGTRIAVGASGTRAMYVFENIGGTWTQTQKFTDPENPGTFANSVAIMGSNTAAGDTGDDEGGVTDRGAVYTMTLPLAPASDVCSSAVEMPLSEFQVCTRYATASTPANATTCGTAATQGPDVWYAFTPTCSGNAIIDTFGSDFDTVLSVHTVCPGPLGTNTLVCNDDASFPAPNNRASLVTFNFTMGTTYLVRIAGYNGASGVANVRPSFYYSYPNDTCAGAAPVSEGSYTFSNCGAGTESSTPMCASPSVVAQRDLWYTLTPIASGTYSINTCGSTFDTVMSVYSGCPTGGGVVLACNDDYGGGCANPLNAGVQVNLTAGVPCTIRVGAFNSNDTGPFNLNIVAPAPPCDPDLNQDGNVDQDDVAYLINVIGGGANPAGIDPDFNRDGNADQDDVSALINVVAGGACP